jgi:hypothetical protein
MKASGDHNEIYSQSVSMSTPDNCVGKVNMMKEDALLASHLKYPDYKVVK